MPKKRTDRLEQLQATLEAGGFLRLKDAAKLLGVSEMTVRRDIAACEGCFTYLGGYITLAQEAPGRMGYILDRERDAHADLKRAACTVAADLIEPGDTIFIDCGTTTPHLASLVPVNSGITVVTYAMNVAEIVCKKPGMRVIVLGGLYHSSSASFSSAEAVQTLRGLGINKAFISAGGVHDSLGVSCSHFHEVDIKQIAIGNAVTRILVVDSSKFDTVKPVFFAKLDSFNVVCCDEHITDVYRAHVEAMGARLITP